LVALSGYKKSLSKSRGFPLLSRLKKIHQTNVSSTIKCIPKIQYFSFIYTRQCKLFQKPPLILQFINQTHRSVFLTGKAGTGKPHFTEIIQTTHKNTVVVAPTGIAALNAGGVTIHSHVSIAV
jgi:hypothetical protein